MLPIDKNVQLFINLRRIVISLVDTLDTYLIENKAITYRYKEKVIMDWVSQLPLNTNISEIKTKCKNNQLFIST